MTTAREPIPWGPGTTEDSSDILVANPSDHVTMGLLERDDGWTVTFTLGVSDRRSLPEVEDFMLRCAKLLEDEPVQRE